MHLKQRGSRGAIEVLTEQLKLAPGDLRARWLLNIAFMTVGEWPDKVPSDWLIPPKVFESEYDIKRFPDVAGALGLAVDDLAGGCILDDFDNDGLLDIVASSWSLRGQLRMFRNEGNGRFAERTVEAGLTGLVSGLNIQQTDYNNDGDQDVYAIIGGAVVGDHYPNSLYLNPGHGNWWLKLHCVGTRSNRAAIGARIKVTVQTPDGPRSIHKTVNSGGSFGSSPLRQEIGLGNATAILQVDIRWPASGLRQTLRGLDLDHAYRVREGDAQAVAPALPKIRFDTNARPAHVHAMVPKN